MEDLEIITTEREMWSDYLSACKKGEVVCLEIANLEDSALSSLSKDQARQLGEWLIKASEE